MEFMTFDSKQHKKTDFNEQAYMLNTDPTATHTATHNTLKGHKHVHITIKMLLKGILLSIKYDIIVAISF